MFTLLKNKIHEIAPDLQFWGYEGGNVLAAIAGAGGFFAFYEGLRSVSEIPTDNLWSTIATAFSTYPDIIVTAGLAVIVLLTIFLGRFLGASDSGQVKTWIDRTSSLAGIGLVLGALYFGASWITFTAVSFVSASALLRLCRTSPVFLKLGGLMLAAGGFGLAGYGLSTVQDTQSALLPGLTVLTGIYVFFASLMTYQGGIYECNACQEELGGAPSSNDPFRTDGLLARLLVSRLDRPIGVLVKCIALPSVFWVSRKTKSTAPFLTSMWTRLPWRVLTGIAAVATGTTVGVLFGVANMLWAIGDVAIGSLDWKLAET
ncbi:hypothetical protein [Labrenzia sp. DG1229]|uniref:hypothetical protein n=1 Tax=Labrenzia sp. DG1229 TaxID=681847 RepID=UPI000491A7BE|nr:hypothetical protein [Labrenzia sp. DG1229]